MEKALKLLVEKRAKEKRIPFCISRLNKLFIIALILSLVLFQSSSMIIFKGLSTKLSARDLKSRRINMLTEKKNEDLHFDNLDYAENTKEIKEDQSSISSETMEMKAPGGESMQGERPEEPTDRLKRGKQLTQVPEAHIEKSDSQKLSKELSRGLKQNKSGSYSRFPGASSEKGPALYSKDQESRGIGKSFIESPLKDYSTVPESLPAEGGQDLAAGFTITEDQRRLFLNSLFSDFLFGPPGISEFDPLIDRIKDHYLRLMHERY